MIEAKTLAALSGIRHGFFTREGGVSDGVYASLNCGVGSRDDPERVRENRARVTRTLGIGSDKLATPYQVHSADVVIATSPWDRASAPKVDGVVTNTTGLALGVLTADCAPVLFCDREQGVIGAAHAGWRGALAGVLERTVAAMEELGARRDAVCAAIGPAISQAAYEVGEDFRETFLAAAESNAHYFRRPDPSSKPFFDLPGFAADRLRALGLEKVEVSGLCTYAAEARFFSFRRATHRGEADYGRQISAIVLD